MVLTDKELRQLREMLEAQSGLNSELLVRCGSLIHMGKFDEAVRSAFVLLEERLRKAVNKDGMTGTRLANYAFNSENGPLAKHLGRTQQEREALRELYSGAFKLFRNPTAHGFIGYEADEGKAILYFVNLLLMFLERAAELPPPATFIEPVEAAIEMIDREINPNVASRLRVFLGKCQNLGLKSGKAKNWLPFRSYALQARSQWPEPKPHRLTVFYLLFDEKNPGLWFPVNQYYKNVQELDMVSITLKLAQLGFVPSGSQRDYRLNLREKNSQTLFNDLYALIVEIEEKLAATLR